MGGGGRGGVGVALKTDLVWLFWVVLVVHVGRAYNNLWLGYQ